MSMIKDEIISIVQNLNEKRGVIFSDITSIDEKYIAQFTGSILLGGTERIEISIGFPPHFPLILPDFFIKDNNRYRAHVGSDGKVCLFDTSAILIKKGMADQLLIDCFDQAIKILNIRPGSKEYNSEVCREFDSYWLSVRQKKAYSCLDTYGIKYRECPMVISNGVSVIADTKLEAERIISNIFGLAIDKETFERTCIVVRIRNGSSMIPLSKQFKWNIIRRYIINNTTSSVKNQFRKFLEKKVKHSVRYVLLIYPATEGDILFGFRVEFNNSKYNKIENSIASKVENAYIERIDYTYLTMRSGAPATLRDKKILLLGCGSVGGYIASNLCQVGIMNIDILDNDILKPENIHRHLLGFDSINPSKNRYKADLVKAYLEEKYLYADVDSLNYVDRNALTFISDISRLKDYDLIISALGEPTINLEINRIIEENALGVPFICCFNEPYGIGGHVVSINLEKNSCLQCFYTDQISSDIVHFRGSFVAPGQSFKKNLSGCSSAFVPYNCLDSQQTALLAVRKAIDILNDNLTKNTLSSWIGSSEEMVSNGFLLSNWYMLNKEKGFINMDAVTNPHCKICRQNDGK